MKKIHLTEVDSTNIFINNVEESDVVVVADYQTAGRGQGSNTWESERGRNLTFSMKVSPKQVAVSDYFLLSMVGALALKRTLDEYVEGITLKWPNDIYWHDRKISGTLINTTISGKYIQTCVFGVGLNINQREFHSDAPNPVSLYQITGMETDREEVLDKFIGHFDTLMTLLKNGGAEHITLLYHQSLYRREGFHAYEDKDGAFDAEIVKVKHNGHLLLRDTEGREREYELKEVRVVLSKK